MSTVNTQVLEDVVCFHTEVSIWSGRKKLIPEDLGLSSDQIPPSELASLGSKKICDPDLLSPFQCLKRRSERALSEFGIRFLGGYAVPAAEMARTAKELDEIQNEFTRNVSQFVAVYDDAIEEWIKAHPKYETALRKSAISSAEVATRFKFGWNAFKIVSATEDDQSPVNQSLKTQAMGLKDRLIEEVAQSAQSLLEVTNKRGIAYQRTLRPLKGLRRKLQGLAFLDPKIKGIVAIIDQCIQMMPAGGDIEGIALITFTGVLQLLGDPERIKNAGQKVIDGAVPSQLLAAEIEIDEETDELTEGDENLALPLQEQWAQSNVPTTPLVMPGLPKVATHQVPTVPAMPAIPTPTQPVVSQPQVASAPETPKPTDTVKNMPIPKAAAFPMPLPPKSQGFF